MGKQQARQQNWSSVLLTEFPAINKNNKFFWSGKNKNKIMLGVKKLKKGDLLWQTNCQNDGAEVNFQPAIFVRNVRGDNVLIDIVQSSGDLKRESAPLKNLAISTLETISEIDFKSNELKKASTEAYEIMKKNQADKGFKSAVVRLEKITMPNEISELEKSEEK